MAKTNKKNAESGKFFLRMVARHTSFKTKRLGISIKIEASPERRPGSLSVAGQTVFNSSLSGLLKCNIW